MTDSTFPSRLRRHPRPLGWAVSLVVHAVVVTAVLLVGREAPRLAPPSVRVTLDGPSVTEGPARWPAPADPRRRKPRASPGPLGPPQSDTVPVPRSPGSPPGDPRWLNYQRESSRAAVQWWGDRSLAACVEDWRQGAADPDSLLDPSPLPARELAREALDVAFRREFLLRADDWERERFREAYRRNFPLMQ